MTDSQREGCEGASHCNDRTRGLLEIGVTEMAFTIRLNEQVKRVCLSSSCSKSMWMRSTESSAAYLKTTSPSEKTVIIFTWHIMDNLTYNQNEISIFSCCIAYPQTCLNQKTGTRMSSTVSTHASFRILPRHTGRSDNRRIWQGVGKPISSSQVSFGIGIMVI